MTSVNNSNASIAAMQVTVYSDGPAVVHEERTLPLAAGKNLVRLDLAKGFVAGSLTFTSYRGEAGAQIELGPVSYKPASLSAATILKECIGSDLTIFDPEFPEDSVIGGESAVTGKLLHILSDHLVLTANRQKIELVPITKSQRYAMPLTVLQNLTDRPSLQIEPTTSAEGEYTLGILYAVDGLRWTRRYELFYDSKSWEIRKLICWVELTNLSGSAISANFKLLAGVNQGYGQFGQFRNSSSKGSTRTLGIAKTALESLSSEPVEDIGEQKMYHLPAIVGLEADETKQLILFAKEDVKVVEKYLLPEGRYQVYSQNEAVKLSVYKTFNVINLGIAMPSGPVNIFEADSSGAYQRTDTTEITGHVAVGEEFRLSFGVPVSDIKALRRLISEKEEQFPTESSEPDTKTSNAGKSAATAKYATFREEAREIKIFNYKSCAVNIEVREYLPVFELQFIAPFTVDGGFKSPSTSTSFTIDEISPAGSTSGSDVITVREVTRGVAALLVTVPQGSIRVTYTIKYRLN